VFRGLNSFLALRGLILLPQKYVGKNQQNFFLQIFEKMILVGRLKLDENGTNVTKKKNISPTKNQFEFSLQFIHLFFIHMPVVTLN
jgi:hypothetical protein